MISGGPLPIASNADIVAVRQQVRTAAVESGFSLIDQTKVVTAASELARNALVYAGGGQVRIEVVETAQRRGLRLEFRDEGPGIPAPDQVRIFERFWRGDPSRGRTAAGGAGLGLSIVDALVRAHGGTVAVESTSGQGAAFTLRLPLRRREGAPA